MPTKQEKLLAKASFHLKRAGEVRLEWWTYRHESTKMLLAASKVLPTDNNFYANLQVAMNVLRREAELILKSNYHIKQYQSYVKKLNKLATIKNLEEELNARP